MDLNILSLKALEQCPFLGYTQSYPVLKKMVVMQGQLLNLLFSAPISASLAETRIFGDPFIQANKQTKNKLFQHL